MYLCAQKTYVICFKDGEWEKDWAWVGYYQRWEASMEGKELKER